MARFLGEGIDESVAKQIEARGSIMSRSPRNESDLKYLNQRTGWVRVTSMVNVGDSSEEAKKLILQGGTVRLNGDSLTMRGGISLNGNTDGAYNTTGAVGTRPMPGITSFNIVSKNRFGTIREANVEFNVWSLEDLKLVEQLYFRVGYSCVIEWGHSIYVKNDGTVQNARTTPNYKQFFDKKTRDGYQAIITKAKKDTDHNYDGLIGLIKNFSWSFRKDGGYNCSISVISLGEVIASIKASRVMVDFPKQPGEDSSEEANVAIARKSPFHVLYYALQKADISPRKNSGGLVPIATIKEKLKNKDDILKSFEKVLTEVQKEEQKGGIGDPTSELFIAKEFVTDRWGIIRWSSEKKHYITLRTFLAIINRFFLLKDGKDIIPRFETGNDGNDISFIPTFRTYDGHYTADPWVVLLPSSERTINNLDPKKITFTGPSGDKLIWDLTLSLEYILEKLDPLLSGDDPEFSVLTFVQSVIDGLEAPLGNINAFDITYDEDSALYAIVDRNNVRHTKDTIPVIDLAGLKSTVIDLTIETKITDKLVSTIAIAAQAQPKGYAKILASQIAWNEGYLDRVITRKTQSTKPDEETQDEVDERRSKYEKLLSKTYNKLNKVRGPDNNDQVLFSEYNISDWNGLIPESSYFQANAININTNQPKAQPLAGIVPVEVSFTMQGISSLKIGEVFKIPKNLLPEKYDQFSYLVTGLDHSINNGSWISRIKANPLVYPSK